MTVAAAQLQWWRTSANSAGLLPRCLSALTPWLHPGPFGATSGGTQAPISLYTWAVKCAHCFTGRTFLCPAANTGACSRQQHLQLTSCLHIAGGGTAKTTTPMVVGRTIQRWLRNNQLGKHHSLQLPLSAVSEAVCKQL